MTVSEATAGEWFTPDPHPGLEPAPEPEPATEVLLLPPTGSTEAAREAQAAAKFAVSVLQTEADHPAPSYLGALVARHRLTEAAIWSCDRDRIIAAIEAEAEALSAVVDAVNTRTYAPPAPQVDKTRRFATTPPTARHH